MSENAQGNMQIITTATRSYLDRVAVLADSLREHHPNVRLRCYLVESDISDSDSCGGRFDIAPVTALDLPTPNHFLFQYTPFELCCALKPFAMLHELAAGAERVLYLDADMLVTHPFLDILTPAWERGILATPHLRRPEIDTDFTYFLRTGHYNAGFLGARNTPAARELLTWWRDRLATQCYRDYYGGILDDQRWLDMAIALFDATDVLHHPGINTAHWNLQECTFRQDGQTIQAAPDAPLCLFHFSTFQHPGLTTHPMVSKEIPPLINDLAASYAQRLEDVRAGCPAATPGSFEQCTDGTPITPAMREAVRLGRIPPDVNPFADPDAVRTALPSGNPNEILASRVDYKIATQAAAAERLPDVEKQLWQTRNRLQRIEQHPVIGRILRLWHRLANPDL